MEHYAGLYLRQVRHLYLEQGLRGLGHSQNVPFFVGHIMAKSVDHFAEEEEADKQERSRRRAQLSSSPGAVAPEDVSDVEGLLAVAKRLFPLCMSQIIRDAIVFGRHPKHGARTALVMFLLECGYSTGEINRVMFLLYSADQRYTNQIAAKRCKPWDYDAYSKDFGPQVKALHETVIKNETSGAYGCTKLIADGDKGMPHGCPFTSHDTEATVALLEWSERSVVDIEDIMRPAQFANERCCRDYQAKHPTEQPIAVKHPNMFMRIVFPGVSATKRAKIGAKE
jgi:DNA primase large subunit